MEMQSYEAAGIETYIYVATLDLRTSEVCRELDGKRFPVSKQEPGKNCPPMHPWCRSTTICDVSPEELAQMKRRARDPNTGKTDTAIHRTVVTVVCQVCQGTAGSGTKGNNAAEPQSRSTTI